MQLRNALFAQLTGDTTEMQRQQELLTRFLSAYDRGGTDEAIDRLTREFTALEHTFGQHMNELNQLL